MIKGEAERLPPFSLACAFDTIVKLIAERIIQWILEDL